MVWSVVLQIGAKALGGREEFADAFRTAVFEQTPYLLPGWTPIVGWFPTPLRSVVPTVLGVRELCRMETGTATAVAPLVENLAGPASAAAGWPRPRSRRAGASTAGLPSRPRSRAIRRVGASSGN